MAKYKVKFRFCKQGIAGTEESLEATDFFEFNIEAPNQQTAQQFGDRVATLHTEMGLTPEVFRPYEVIVE